MKLAHTLLLLVATGCLKSSGPAPLQNVATDCRKELDAYYQSVCSGQEEHQVCSQFIALFDNFQLRNGKPLCQQGLFSRMLKGQARRWEGIVARRLDQGKEVPDYLENNFKLNMMDGFVGEILNGAIPISGREAQASAIRQAYTPFRAEAPDSHRAAHDEQKVEQKIEQKVEQNDEHNGHEH